MHAWVYCFLMQLLCILFGEPILQWLVCLLLQHDIHIIASLRNRRIGPGCVSSWGTSLPRVVQIWATWRDVQQEEYIWVATEFSLHFSSHLLLPTGSVLRNECNPPWWSSIFNSRLWRGYVYSTGACAKLAALHGNPVLHMDSSPGHLCQHCYLVPLYHRLWCFATLVGYQCIQGVYWSVGSISFLLASAGCCGCHRIVAWISLPKSQMGSLPIRLSDCAGVHKIGAQANFQATTESLNLCITISCQQSSFHYPFDFLNRKFSSSQHFPLSLLLDKQPKWVSLSSNEEPFYHEDHLSYILSKSSTHRNPNPNTVPTIWHQAAKLRSWWNIEGACKGCSCWRPFGQQSSCCSVHNASDHYLHQLEWLAAMTPTNIHQLSPAGV